MRVFSIDRQQVEDSVKNWIEELRRRHPEVIRAIWFGSWIHGRPTPRSDVDICLVLRASDKRFRERIADYLPERFPVSVELFPYTAAEFERLESENPPWYREINRGREI